MFTGIIYQAQLVNTSNPDDVLKDVIYIGQSIKQDKSEQDILQIRRSQHENCAKNTNKDFGFMFVLQKHGKHAFIWKVIESKTADERLVIADWANEREKYHIANNGGIFTNIDKKINQTFNLTLGGQGNPKFYWDSMIARSNRKWQKFMEYLKKFKKEYNHYDVPCSYKVGEYNLGKTVISVRGGNMIDAFPERKQQLYDIGFTGNLLDKKFEILYKHLKDFKIEYGHCNVPQSYTVAEYNLGSILSGVRQGSYNKYLDQLIELDFDLIPLETHWEEVKIKLQDFFNKNGHCNVPYHYEDIGKVVNHIRNRQDFIKEDPSRVIFLNSINFDFKPKETVSENSWKLFWNHMTEYYIKNNNYQVSSTFVCDDGYNLGSHISSIRNAGQFRDDEDKMKLLVNINFSFDPLEDNWQEFKTELLKFKNYNKTCKVPYEYITSDTQYRLGQTVSTVRRGTYLNIEGRRDYLTSLGFIWSVHDAAWDAFVNHLNASIFSGVTINRDTVCKDGYLLGSRIHNIKTRGQFIKNKPDREKYLYKFGIIL